MDKLTVGLLAHVDAGKTTLTEALLYNSGAIRKIGRVDHRDSFLDTDPIERERGITVFSKQARFSLNSHEVTLVDTPGHADLSPEMERTLWVLDYAILLINASDGVTSQSKLLWKLLSHHEIPTFIFVNKMDRPDTDKAAILKGIKKGFGSSCVDFKSDSAYEDIALCDEALLEEYLNTGNISDSDIVSLIKSRSLFPVFFGSALKGDGIKELLSAMDKYMCSSIEKETFSARVYKISRDIKGNRLAWLKVTGGTLSVRQLIEYDRDGEHFAEKLDGIRLYSGDGYTDCTSAGPGTICAVTGLSAILSGSVLGDDTPLKTEIIEPVLTYEIDFDSTISTSKMLEMLQIIEEEEPQLHVKFSERTGRISVQVMGKVQMEVLKRTMSDRFGTDISFGAQTIIYKETVAKATEGVGHFEPLRHYAEVRLLIEPLERGGGVQIENLCSRDELEPHWQKLIISYLSGTIHTGVLTDSELTDVRISLLGGRSHKAHTQSSDFRKAAFRALRQGLMENISILLEPYMDFTLTVPDECTGRALYDISLMDGENEAPVSENGISTIKGKAPASALSLYQESVTVYTAGRGHITCTLSGYDICKNPKEVVDRIGYDPLSDVYNPSSSVFCSHGMSTIVQWDMVKEYMHTQSSWTDEDFEYEADNEISESTLKINRLSPEEMDFKERSRHIDAAENELKEIFNRTYGAASSSPKPGWKSRQNKNDHIFDSVKSTHKKPRIIDDEYLLVDGYNIIFAWNELKSLAVRDIGAARDMLCDILSNYQGTYKGNIILVFDAYKVKGGKEEVIRYHNIDVIYTKEAETADQYIEKSAHTLSKNNLVKVATSDGIEQIIIYGTGAVRVSAADLKYLVDESIKEMREKYSL